MTVSVGWVLSGQTFKYGFSPDWSWTEFLSARKIAETIIRNESEDDAIIDIIVDYTEASSYIPNIPRTEKEPPMGHQNSHDDPPKKKGKHNKKSIKYGHDRKIPQDNSISPNVPDMILSEHKWIIPVSKLTIIGCSKRLSRVIKDMLKPACEWDTVDLIESSGTMDIDYKLS